VTSVADSAKGATAEPADPAEPIPVPPLPLGVRVLRVLVPVVMLALLIGAWQAFVVALSVPDYVVPGPVRVAQAMVDDWPILFAALLVTLRVTAEALLIAVVGGTLLAIVMAEWRSAELALYPYAVVLQVTPIVAIAPLIIIYSPSKEAAVLICAWIVSFFPMLSNTLQGLRSTDHNLLSLFELYGASRWQTLLYLKLPSALPYFLTGLRIAGGLALIGAVVAEFALGPSGTSGGLAFRLIESQFRLRIPRVFASLVLLSVTGVVIFAATSAVSYLLLRRWHESAIRREH
jgi:NitT/TauT family transport system permease protein